ncbi:hypothetical protein D3C81_779010 [compost metagenome]
MVDQTSQFYAILTTIGAAKQANADALGIPWTFTQMAVGDGNPTALENPPLPMPTATQTALLNEWRRAPLNQLKVDPSNAAVIIAEQIIPADVGGKWIRELSLYDADGDMVAVANCPPTFKPLLSQGSGRTQVVRLNLLIGTSSNVQLKIDPAVVLATREWVTEELAKQDFKHSVVAATTAAIALNGLQTVDGVVLTAGARVLVKNQAAAKDNGLYLVVAGGAWTRCPDADSSAKVTPGMLVLVERGTVNADSAWQLLTDAPITVGVSDLVYGMAFGRTGVAAGTYRSVQVDTYGRVVAATNPTTVAGYGLTDVYTKTQVDDAVQAATAKATQAEAEAGADNAKLTTPLRVFQALRSAAAVATEALRGVLRVATQAEVNAGALDYLAVTPQKLRFGIILSLYPNGYVLFPQWLGSWCIQWGTETIKTEGDTITFPLAFPSMCWNVTMGNRSTIGGNNRAIGAVDPATVNVNGFRICTNTLVGTTLNINLYYIALGK